MTQDHATPVPGRALMVVRAGTEAGPAAVPPVPDASTGPGTEPVPVPAAPVPMSVPERTRRAVSRWLGTGAKAAGELWFYPNRFLHSFVRPEPETMKEHWAHVQSRAWVPGEMTGTPEKVVTALGLFHHLFVAYPVKAAAKAAKFTAEKVDEAADRPLRLYGLGVFLAILIVLLFVL